MWTCARSRLTWQSVFGGGKEGLPSRETLPPERCVASHVLSQNGQERDRTSLIVTVGYSSEHTGWFTEELSLMGESVNKKRILLNRNRIQTLPGIQVNPANRTSSSSSWASSKFRWTNTRHVSIVTKWSNGVGQWHYHSLSSTVSIITHLLQPKDPPSLHRKPIKLSGC